MTHKIKKKVMIMVHEIKKIETKLPRLGVNIRLWGCLAGFLAVAGLIWACGATIPTVAGIYLGYKLLKLILRILGLVVSILISVVSATILAIIISLLIF